MTTNTKKYSYEEKIILKDKIEDVKSKRKKIQIMKIIMKDKNFNVNEISESGSGILLYFNKLADETYQNIEEYLNNLSTLNSETEQSINFSSLLSANEPEFYNDPANKFNNREKQFIKRTIRNSSKN